MLFMVSDALMGVERFVAPFPLASIAILATYWGAQWSLASSVQATRLPDTIVAAPRTA